MKLSDFLLMRVQFEGAEVDEPEGSRYCTFSETFFHEILIPELQRLEKIADTESRMDRITERAEKVLRIQK